MNPTPLRIPQDDIRGSDHSPCVSCNGTGIITCDHCDEGEQSVDQWDTRNESHYTTQASCNECEGEWERECDECGGGDDRA